MNWINIISDLSLRGMTQQKIAEYCGTGQSTINDIFTGRTKNPSYRLGSLLIELHTQNRRAGDTVKDDIHG